MYINKHTYIFSVPTFYTHGKPCFALYFFPVLTPAQQDKLSAAILTGS